MPETQKPKCPNCGVEIEGTPEACAKCGFNLKDYPNFYGFFKTAFKQLRAEEKAEEDRLEQEKKGKKPAGVMDTLLGKKKG